MVLHGEMKRTEIQEILGLRNENYFREAYLVPALDSGYVEMTIPEKPRSRMQRYRLSRAGAALLARLRDKPALNPPNPHIAASAQNLTCAA
jgi:hypothetical protein